MRLVDILKTLAQNNILTSIQYNIEKNQLLLDLQTEAKSDLHLYEDGLLCGRYNYEKQIDLAQDMDVIVTELCHEFKYALHGRNYYQSAWAELCKTKGINII